MCNRCLAKPSYYAFLSLLFVFLIALDVKAKALDLSGYQRIDGAITVHFDGNYVDPYFATKALLIAKNEGFDVQSRALSWVAWVLPRQRKTGLINRFCINDVNYVECDIADADDASLAVWMELLISLTDNQAMPEEWSKSWHAARHYLDSLLFNRHRGLYIVSRELPVSLLMDNIEVYIAHMSSAKYFETRGDMGRSHLALSKAHKLERNILQTYWSEKENMFTVSTQNVVGDSFYPQRVAQLFPYLSDFKIPVDSKIFYNNWIKQNRANWLLNGKEDYPWGLVALVARKMNDLGSVLCWLEFAKPLRHGKNWNILEEVIYQVLSSNFKINGEKNKNRGENECLAN